MDDVTEQRGRGVGDTLFREVRCKDCLREQLAATQEASGELTPDTSDSGFEYSEAWASKVIERGGSRSDRCAKHRREHRQAIQGIAVAYVDLDTIGEVADRTNPTGPLGGLGELPATHRPKTVSVDLAQRPFGMTDDHIREALRKLGNDRTRVLVLRAGTGTGKSTFGPYRLMNPPCDQPGDDKLLRITTLGPIVVTEPRVQATTGVARFVGEKLVAGCKWKACSLHGRFVPAADADPDRPEGPDHDGEVTDECVITDCTDHIGPGFPVGYQVKGDKKHDDSCQLIYVTDGTMVNWLREGRLSKIGTVIVDEAHERSVNIDFIMGELKRQLNRYPHLRVIVTSATFDLDFYVDFFGGPDVVESMDVPAVKAFGYGAPFFPYPEESVAAAPPCVCSPVDPTGRSESVHRYGNPMGFESWLSTHWPEKMGPAVAERGPEDLHETTRRLETLRYPGPLIDVARWGREMADAAADQIVRMIKGLDDEKRIHGDILAFLPTEKLIKHAKGKIEAAIPAEQADVFGLIGSMPKDEQAAALAARPADARRKVVLATNLAETSLTVKGVRFVVDTGIITQETWDPVAASRNVPTRPHSQSGLRQRWGRVGRDEPGWVFPLYTADQFKELPLDTPPGSTRANLEKLLMTAKAGGVDDVADFPWPAQHKFGSEDESATEARENFGLEVTRASHALEVNGIVDEDGHLTTFGQEIQRFSVMGASAVAALAVMFADQLACVPEVSAALALLDVQHLVGKDKLFLDDDDWLFDEKSEAHLRRRALRAGCTDDLDLALRVAAAWDRADPEARPWESSDRRRRWCNHWWLSETVLLKAAETRHETLAALSPAMKEEVKRFVDPRLAERARAVLSRATTSLQYIRQDDGRYVSAADSSTPLAALDRQAFSFADEPDRLLALSRQLKGSGDSGTVYLKHLVRVLPWACDENLDVFDLLEHAAREVAPRVLANRGEDPLLSFLTTWPVGARFTGTVNTDQDGVARVGNVHALFEPGALPGTSLAETQPEPLEPPTSSESNWLLGEATPDENELRYQPVDTTDDPSDPEKGLETNDDDSTKGLAPAAEPHDVLEAWHKEAKDASLEHTTVVLAEGARTPTQSSAYACIGYEITADHRVSLRLATDIVAVEVDIADDSRGRVIGSRRNRLERMQSLPGIIACDVDDAGPLRIIGISEDSVRTVLNQVDRAPSRVTGTMRMPSAERRGRLIGKDGQEIKRLREESGCTTANCERGSIDWQLAAPSADSIRRFVELANQMVPGCVGELSPSPPAVPVRDAVSGQVIANWRHDPLGSVPVTQWPPSLTGLRTERALLDQQTSRPAEAQARRPEPPVRMPPEDVQRSRLDRLPEFVPYRDAARFSKSAPSPAYAPDATSPLKPDHGFVSPSAQAWEAHVRNLSEYTFERNIKAFLILMNRAGNPGSVRRRLPNGDERLAWEIAVDRWMPRRVALVANSESSPVVDLWWSRGLEPVLAEQFDLSRHKGGGNRFRRARYRTERGGHRVLLGESDWYSVHAARLGSIVTIGLGSIQFLTRFFGLWEYRDSSGRS